MMSRVRSVLAVVLVAVFVSTATAPDAQAATVRRHYASLEVGCLDAAQKDGDPALDAYTSACNSGLYQKWDETTLGSNKVLLKQVQTGKCLTGFSTAIELATCNSSATNQQWVKSQESANRYVFRNVNYSRCAQAPLVQGQQLRFAPCDYSAIQQWLYAK